MRLRGFAGRCARGAGAAAALCLLAGLPAKADATTQPPAEGAAATAPRLQLDRQFERHRQLRERWQERLIPTIAVDALPAVEGGELEVVDTAPAVADKTTALTPDQWDSGVSSAAVPGDGALHGDWLILRIFLEHGALPLLLPILGVLALFWVRRQRTAVAVRRRLPIAQVARPAWARFSEGAGAEAGEATDADAIDLDLAGLAAPDSDGGDRAELAGLRARAQELDRVIADPEQRRKLALAFSYLDLANVEAARLQIEDVERSEREAWNALFES